MAGALLPASFVREAPNNQSGVPVIATGHCPVPVRPRRAKTSFPGREAAPLRFAALPALVQKGSSASAVLATLVGSPVVEACAYTTAGPVSQNDDARPPSGPRRRSDMPVVFRGSAWLWLQALG